MKLIIDIPKEFEQDFNKDRFEDSLARVASDIESFGFQLSGRYEMETIKMLRISLKNGTPLPEHLNKIKDDIGKYELDCRFADYSQTDECTICNKNVFVSIYRIIDKYIEGSDSE